MVEVSIHHRNSICPIEAYRPVRLELDARAHAYTHKQVLSYVAGKLEADRVHAASVYANADMVFGDKKGNAKLRCSFQHPRSERHANPQEEYVKLKAQPPKQDVALEQGQHQTEEHLRDEGHMNNTKTPHPEQVLRPLEGTHQSK